MVDGMALLEYCYELYVANESHRYREVQPKENDGWRWVMHPRFILPLKRDTNPLMDMLVREDAGWKLFGWPIAARVKGVLAVQLEAV